MNLPQISISRPVLAVMLNLALVVFGLVSMGRLPIRELPDIDPPIVTVTTIYPGASPDVVETEITERIEAAVNGVEGIKLLSSESRESRSNVTLRFSLDRDIDVATQDVRDRVGRIRGSLPEDVDDPVVAKQDADARPIMWVAAYSDQMEQVELTALAENLLQERLQTVPGVSSIFIGGAKRFAVRIRLDPEKMAALDISVPDVERALQMQNVSLPSGRIESIDREFVIQTDGEFSTAAAFQQMALRRFGDRVVRLQDVGTAFAGVEDERGKARYNGRPTIGLGIVRQSRANTVEVANGVKAEVERLRPMVPDSVNMFVAYDESTYVEESIRQVWLTLAAAFTLVVLTVFLFLGNLRATLIPTLSIPVSIAATFMVLSAFGYSLNIVTMLALVLAIGLVVDDSIVVLENVFRHVEDGEQPIPAARGAMREIMMPVIATTLALVAVFVPMAFQTSTAGRLFIEFAVTLAGAVCISTFVALSLTPMAASRILRSGDGKSAPGRFIRTLNRFQDHYLAVLERALARPGRTVAIGVLLAATAGLLYNTLEQDFLPDEDKGRLFGLAITPEGSTPAYTDRMMRQLEGIVADQPEVAGFFSAVALARGGPGQGNQGFIFVRLHPDRERSAQDLLAGPRGIAARSFGEVEGAFAFLMLPKSIGRGFGQPFELVLQHPDLERLGATADMIAGHLQAAGFLNNVRSKFKLDKPELRLQIDRERAATLGVNVRDISRTLQILFGGSRLSEVKRDGKAYDVIVDLAQDARATVSDIERVQIRNDAGQLVPLGNVVRYSESAGPSAIYRHKRARSATIEASLGNIPIGVAIQRTEQILNEHLPVDFHYEWEGDAQELQDSGTDTLFVILLAILVTYMVMASQFESLVHPFTVMTAIPFGFLGALFALWALGLVDGLGSMFYAMANYAPDPAWWAQLLDWIVPRIPAMNLNLYSTIGLILLLGIVTKNSILLVEFANQAKRSGADARSAMLQAARIRFRPILMTAFATIAGILPIAIGFGAGAEARRPMGIAIVGGMSVSTILTFVIVPAVYVVLDRFNRETLADDQ